MVVRNLIAYLEAGGHTVGLFGQHGGATSRPILDGVAGRGARRVLRNRHAFAVLSAISDFAPDLVWQHDFIANWLAVRLASRSTPAILMNHSAELLKLAGMPYSDALSSLLLSQFDLVVAPSRELANVPARRSRFIPNGVDLMQFSGPRIDSQRASLARQLYEFDGPVVLCARRWAPTKGVDVPRT